MEIRRSYDRLISTMGFPILVRRHLYIESGPSLSPNRWHAIIWTNDGLLYRFRYASLSLSKPKNNLYNHIKLHKWSRTQQLGYQSYKQWTLFSLHYHHLLLVFNMIYRKKITNKYPAKYKLATQLTYLICYLRYHRGGWSSAELDC